MSNRDMSRQAPDSAASPLTPAWTDGSYRTCAPEDTLAFIRPLLPKCGITRVADVTRLDRPGIPTHCAMRPTADILQVTNGKGATHAAAEVSALMEAIELFHAEGSAHAPKRHASREAMLADGLTLVDDHGLPSWRQDLHHDDRRQLDWIAGENVCDGSPVWIPAGAVYFDVQPSTHAPTTNGLASGNEILEASLHALYEVLERDAGSRLSQDGRIRLRDRAQVLKLDTIDAPRAREQIDALSRNSQVIVCHVESVVGVNTFWTVLLNDASHSALTGLNIGWGTHVNREIALTRALTEAAQSRLTHIHGAREDIVIQAGYQGRGARGSAAWRFFEQLTPQTDWNEVPVFEPAGPPDLHMHWNALLEALRSAGYPAVYRFDLTRADIGVPVVKLILPGLQFNERLF